MKFSYYCIDLNCKPVMMIVIAAWGALDGCITPRQYTDTSHGVSSGLGSLNIHPAVNGRSRRRVNNMKLLKCHVISANPFHGGWQYLSRETWAGFENNSKICADIIIVVRFGITYNEIMIFTLIINVILVQLDIIQNVIVIRTKKINPILKLDLDKGYCILTIIAYR